MPATLGIDIAQSTVAKYMSRRHRPRSPGSRLFHISAALAENERDVIRERTIAGLASARARGRKGGRPPKLTSKQVRTARKMLTNPEMTIKEVAEAFGVNRATIYRSLGLGTYAKTQREAVRADR